MQLVGHGHIVALSSVAGFSSSSSSRNGRVPFSTAQFAIQGFAESLHSEFRQLNINIMISLVHVYPFIIDATMAKDIRLRLLFLFSQLANANNNNNCNNDDNGESVEYFFFSFFYLKDSKLFWDYASDRGSEKDSGWCKEKLCRVQRTGISIISRSHTQVLKKKKKKNK